MMYLLVHGLIVLVWLALTGSWTMGNALFAAVLGYLLMATVVQRGESRAYSKRVPAAIVLLFYFLWELVKANGMVALEMVRPIQRMRPGIVGVPLDLEHPVAITLLANLITLTPGTLSLEVSADRKTLYVHAMFVEDPETFRREIKTGFEKRVKEVFL